MSPIETFRLSLSALRERKVRSTLTILMVVVGAALIVSLNGLAGGFNIFIEKQFSNLSPNVVIVTPANTFQGPGNQQESGRTELDARTVRNIQPIDGVADVIPMIQRPVTIAVGSTSTGVTVVGIDHTRLTSIFPTFSLEEGSIVFPYDSTGILLGNEVKYPPGKPGILASLGQRVTLQFTRLTASGAEQQVEVAKKSFLVRGTVKNLGSGAFLQIDRSVAISLPAANDLFGAGGKYDFIFVVTANAALNEKVEKGIREVYGDNIGVASPKVIVQTIQTFVAGFTSFILAIAAISLFVAAVGVITTLITSVMERTREIGLLKALGFRRRNILILFLSEALSIGMVGGFVGVLVGMGLGTFVLPLFTPTGAPGGMIIEAQFTALDLTSVWLFTVAISGAAGLYPAWRASRLDPVVALRKE